MQSAETRAAQPLEETRNPEVNPSGLDENVTALLRGVEVMVYEWTGLPIKNQLPPEFGARFKTRSQWVALGMYPRKGAPSYEMHCSASSKRVFTYYYEDDIVGADSDAYRQSQAELIEDLGYSTGHGGTKALVKRRKAQYDAFDRCVRATDRFLDELQAAAEGTAPLPHCVCKNFRAAACRDFSDRDRPSEKNPRPVDSYASRIPRMTSDHDGEAAHVAAYFIDAVIALMRACEQQDPQLQRSAAADLLTARHAVTPQIRDACAYLYSRLLEPR